MFAAAMSQTDPLSDLSESVTAARKAFASATIAERSDAIASLLATADACYAGAIELLAQGGTHALSGLPNDMQLMLQARKTRSEARIIVSASRYLSSMPNLQALFFQGTISWSQLRSMLYPIRELTARQREKLDVLIADHKEAFSPSSDPDHAVHVMDDLVSSLRTQAELNYEDQTMDHNFLAIQGRLDGCSDLYGHADAETTAILCETLDAAAELPKNAEDDAAPTRAQQRMDALRVVCESYQSAGSDDKARTRPRPRVHAVLDLARYEDKLPGSGMELLWGLIGRSPKLSRVSTEQMLCDAQIIPIITYKGRPLAVGNAVQPNSSAVRRGLIARDKGCRFPGCGAPVQFTDAHHIVPAVGSAIEDLVLLCRLCHRRVHRYHWELKLLDDATIEFHHRGQVFTSRPPP